LSEDPFSGAEVIVEDPLEEAPGDADARALPFVDPDLELCPVVPLGFEGGKVVFAMPEGEIRHEPAAKIGALLRTDIFACAPGQAFLTNWRNKKNEFMREMATVWFVRKCRKAGLWDSSRPLRELGVWPAEDGHLVLHLGDEIWRFADRGKPEVFTIFEMLRARLGPLYRLRPPAPRPRKPCSSEDAQWARDWLDNWSFEAIGVDGLTGADVVVGWLMAALLGGVAPFRGHLLLHALAGSGKTELMLFVQSLLSALAGEVIDSFSEAGLKNELAGNARPVLIDEGESSTDPRGPGVIEKCLELLRRMSTGSGAHRKQGDIGGGSVTLTAVGAAMLAGISPPRLGPADASRFAEVRLLQLGKEAVTRGELEKAKARAKAMAPALLGRALKGAWRYRADVDAVTEAMVKAGQSPRAADLIAMLIAGRRLLLFDKAMSAEEAAAEVRAWAPLLAQREDAEAVANEGADALAHLMSAEARIHVRDRTETIGGLIRRWTKHERDYDDVLAAMGVKIVEERSPDGRDGPWLLVANHHPRLTSIFRGTPWGDWRRALGYLDSMGAEYRTWGTKNSLRFGVGVKQRAIAIPLTPWIEPTPQPAAVAQPVKRSGGVPPPVPAEDAEWSEDYD
jgi:hypothetical protein